LVLIMSKLLAFVAVIAIIGCASAATDKFRELATSRGFRLAPEQAFPREGGICHDAVRGWECPTYEYFRDGIGFEYRLYDTLNMVVCQRVGTEGQAWENLYPCYTTLEAYFNGANSNNLVINRTAPVAIDVAEYNVGFEVFSIIFFLPNNFGKIPDPRVGSGLTIINVPAMEVVIQTFGPTDLFGQGGPAVGDHQLYDAAGTLEYRAARRGIPTRGGNFMFATYSPDRAVFENANLRHEVMLFLDAGGASIGQTVLAMRNSTKAK